jgi:alpha-glucuronidase
MKRILIVLLIFVGIVFLNCTRSVNAEDGYRLWLRYDKIQDEERLTEYQNAIQSVLIKGESETIDVLKDELDRGLTGPLGNPIIYEDDIVKSGTLVVGVISALQEIIPSMAIRRFRKCNRHYCQYRYWIIIWYFSFSATSADL